MVVSQMSKVLHASSVETDIHKLKSANDQDVVAISPETFLSLPALDASDLKLSKKDAAFWREVSNKPGASPRRLPYVAVAIIDGALFKLHGAKRAIAWAAHALKPPTCLAATVHHCDTIQDARDIARNYQRIRLFEEAPAEINAAYRQHGLSIESYVLRRGQISRAIYFAFRGSSWNDPDHPYDVPINLTEAVGLLKDELTFLDKTGCPQLVFYSGVLAMAFVGLATEPLAKSFIEKLAAKAGNKRDGQMDPVEAVGVLSLMCGFMDNQRSKSFQLEMFGRSLRGLSAWCGQKDPKNQFWFKGKLWQADPLPWVKRFREAKGIENRIDL